MTQGGALAGMAALGVLSVAGCASPGPARPPSLNLPDTAAGLTAARLGDEVTLRWTTPGENTDHMPTKGAVTAEICRESGAAAAALVGASPAPVAGAGAGDRGGIRRGKAGQSSASGKSGIQGCAAVERIGVQFGLSEARDALPPGLAGGPAGLVAYRVQLKNAAGRTAGPSNAVFVPAGVAPGAVKGFRGRADKAGAVMEWRPADAPEAAIGAPVASDAVELDRFAVPGETTGGERAVSGESSGPKSGAASRKAPAEVRFRAGGASDPGGAVDRTAKIGETYLYTAARVRTVVLDGQRLEMRSADSAAVKVEMADVFPPEPPVGLVASPGFVRGAGGEAEHGAIDLSWEPSVEVRVVGYRVYRRTGEGGEWVRLNAQPVAAPAYRDATVEAGTRYMYRVTAVDSAGHESRAGDVVLETGPGE